mgnify:CR=1 FL=1
MCESTWTPPFLAQILFDLILVKLPRTKVRARRGSRSETTMKSRKRAFYQMSECDTSRTRIEGDNLLLNNINYKQTDNWNHIRYAMNNNWIINTLCFLIYYSIK